MGAAGLHNRVYLAKVKERIPSGEAVPLLNRVVTVSWAGEFAVFPAEMHYDPWVREMTSTQRAIKLSVATVAAMGSRDFKGRDNLQ